MGNNATKFKLVIVLLCSLLLSLNVHVFVADAANGGARAGGGEGGNAVIVGRSGKVGDMSKRCNADVTSLLPSPYNNASDMVCEPVWDKFLLRYHVGEGNVMTFVVSGMYTTGWLGMAFSPEGDMVESSAMVGWFNSKGDPTIKQYYLQGQSQSEVTVDSGKIPLTKIPPAIVLYQGTIHMAFQAKFDKPLTTQWILFAFGTKYPQNYNLSMHDDAIAINFDFSSGLPFVRSNLAKIKWDHGALGILSWGLLLPIGAIFARYLKHKDPLWYNLHIAFQFLGFLLGFATVVLGTRLYVMIHADLPIHRGIGFFVLFLSILQILAICLRPNKEAKIRKYWNWYHHWFGRTALFFGALNVALGIKIGGAGHSMKIAFGLPISIIIITVIILEILSRLGKSKSTLNSVYQMNPI